MVIRYLGGQVLQFSVVCLASCVDGSGLATAFFQVSGVGRSSLVLGRILSGRWLDHHQKPPLATPRPFGVPRKTIRL